MPKSVIIYSTPTCTYCKQAKLFFKEHKIKFKEVDVSSDQKAAREMITKSGQMSVPVIEIGKDIILGFNKDKIKQALGIK